MNRNIKRNGFTWEISGYIYRRCTSNFVRQAWINIKMLIAHLNYIFLILLSVCCFHYFTWFKFRYYVLVINIFIDTGTHEMHCDFVYLTIYLYAYIYKCIYIWQTDWLNEIINLWMCMPNACVSSDAPVCMGVCMY